jgi:hypothetical protein
MSEDTVQRVCVYLWRLCKKDRQWYQNIFSLLFSFLIHHDDDAVEWFKRRNRNFLIKHEKDEKNSLLRMQNSIAFNLDLEINMRKVWEEKNVNHIRNFFIIFKTSDNLNLILSHIQSTIHKFPWWMDGEFAWTKQYNQMAIIYWKKINKLFIFYIFHLARDRIGSKSEMEIFQAFQMRREKNIRQHPRRCHLACNLLTH